MTCITYRLCHDAVNMWKCIYRTTILAAVAFLDAFQKVADMATNSRGRGGGCLTSHTFFHHTVAICIFLLNLENRYCTCSFFGTCDYRVHWQLIVILWNRRLLLFWDCPKVAVCRLQRTFLAPCNGAAVGGGGGSKKWKSELIVSSVLMRSADLLCRLATGSRRAGQRSNWLTQLCDRREQYVGQKSPANRCERTKAPDLCSVV